MQLGCAQFETKWQELAEFEYIYMYLYLYLYL